MSKWLATPSGAGAQSVTVPTGCGFDPHSRRWNIYLNLYFHFFPLVSRTSAALSFAPQHAMPPEFSRKWATECINTRFPLPTLLCAGHSVKLIIKNNYSLNKYLIFIVNKTFSSRQHLVVLRRRGMNTSKHLLY